MFKLISVSKLADLAKDEKVQLVDIREDKEYAAGHLPGAFHINKFFYYLSESDAEGIQSMEETFTEILCENGIVSELPVVIYEEEMDKKYGGSCRGAFLMTLFGHREVYVLHGGYSAWVQQGLPVSNVIPKKNKSNYKIKLDRTLFVDYKEMLDAINHDDIFLLDNRDRDEWIGVSSSPYGIDYSPRKGRIPGAHWLEWYNLMETVEELPMFKSNDAIQEIAAEHGINKDSNIIIYCFKGSRASNTLLALYKAGFNNVKVYFASWYEWSKRPELPIDDRILDD